MKLRIVTDGNPNGTHLYGETGEELRGVIKVELMLEVGQPTKAVVTRYKTRQDDRGGLLTEFFEFDPSTGRNLTEEKIFDGVVIYHPVQMDLFEKIEQILTILPETMRDWARKKLAA